MSSLNWSELPEELLMEIAKRINSIEDFVRFGVVCHSWRSVTLNKRHYPLILNTPPWLMLPEEKIGKDRSFCNLFENRYYHLNLPDEASVCCWWGSPYGWLASIDFEERLHLINPLSGTRRPLPDELTKTEFLHKVVVSCPSSSSANYDDQHKEFLVFALSISQLAFTRPGDAGWTYIGHCFCNDVIHYKGQYYSVDSYGVTWLCDITSPCPKAIKLASSPQKVVWPWTCYLVELQGQLHLVIRVMKGSCSKRITSFIRVYRLDLSTYKWQELENLGDYAIFIGSNTSFSLPASNYSGCKPSCIYFTGATRDMTQMSVSATFCNQDMGIYNVETGKFESFCDGNDIVSEFSPHVWIRPNLNLL